MRAISLGQLGIKLITVVLYRRRVWLLDDE